VASRAGIRKDIPILFEIALSSLEQPVELFLGFGKLPERALREPRRIRDLAKATGHWAKTNVLDAEVLARFAEVIRPHPRPPADGGTAQLRELTFRRQPLIKMTTAERNRLKAEERAEVMPVSCMRKLLVIPKTSSSGVEDRSDTALPLLDSQHSCLCRKLGHENFHAAIICTERRT